MVTVVTRHNRHQGVSMRTANAGCHATRAIGYLRVSTNGQAENGYGLEAQRDQVEQFCADHGWSWSASTSTS